MALTFTPSPKVNETCPDFNLPAVDGKKYQKSDFFKGRPLLVMFICNHCPYVKAIEDRLIQLGHDLKTQGIDVLAICSNDSSEYPEDNFDNLKKRWSEKKYPFHYLHDANQDAALDFGAVCTPDFFLYDTKAQLQYRGRLDDSWKDASKVSRRDLYLAAAEINAGMSFTEKQIPSMGCSIKWLKDKS